MLWFLAVCMFRIPFVLDMDKFTLEHQMFYMSLMLSVLRSVWENSELSVTLEFEFPTETLFRILSIKYEQLVC
jgi:hypothetical protein